VPFNPGDFFVFYSDGLTEAKNRNGNLYGEKGLVDFVVKNARFEPENIINKLWEDVVEFSESETFDDDITCVIVKIEKESSGRALSYESELEINSELKELKRVRAFVREFCENMPETLINRNRINLIELAVTEVTSNIIKHAYNKRDDKQIIINAKASNEEIALLFCDWGKEFDPKSVPPPLFDGSQEGGFGLYIIAHTVDEVEYSRNDKGKNCTCLKFNLTGG
ncbi:MAG: ATP-binding protein, partial [Desulfobacterales bacterium]|nr:ATP-binding protein [Desulfobacterales bacterium]